MEAVADQIFVVSKLMTTYFNNDVYTQNQTVNYMMQEYQQTYMKPSTIFFTLYSANKLASTVFANFFAGLSDKIEYVTYSFKQTYSYEKNMGDTD